MSILSFAALFLHVIAAVSWIGGMVFLSIALGPLLRNRQASAEVVGFFRAAARRFRMVVWMSIAVLLGSGPMLLHARGLSIIDPGAWPTILTIKLTLVFVLLVFTVLHDLVLGPEIRQAAMIPVGERTTRQQLVVHSASWIPRLALLLSLVVVATALALARS